MGGIIIYSFLIAGGICLIAVSIFMWLNARGSSVDDNSYDETFQAGKLVSKYRVNTQSDEDTFSAKSMERYAQRPPKNQRPEKKTAQQDDNKKADSNELEHDEEPGEHLESDEDTVPEEKSAKKSEIESPTKKES